ncbi:hypothetical protein [Sphingomonas sp. S2-65]|uniref:hypothetical protein n=1 Tax=Sphingomonas sp. S2-65 TaxID=2903960 RepID=UPI001F46CFDF|nr:hypothetical protein [Sphingomonas sp. S2-65]UYY58948.1 hypothetical protein LZ586_02250 [Sphingomonas sp. S2-65]
MRRLVPLLAIGLSACADPTGPYPSLLPRAVEKQNLAEPERRAPVAVADPALDARIATISASLDDAEKRFASAARDAEAKVAVARGLAAGSERWLDAQVALSTLDALRAPVTTLQTDLETLVIERGASGQPPYPALQEAAKRADAVGAGQASRISALEAALAGA